MGHYTDAPEDNLLGITDKQQLNEEEARGVVRAEAFLLDLELPVELTTGLPLEIHRVTFGHLYDWAGQWRRSNPNVGSFVPPVFQQVPTLMYQFVEEVRFRQERVGSEAEVVQLLAYAHHRLVAIHPFTNGNGRMARLLTNLLAFLHGYQDVALYAREAGESRKKYLQAMRLGDTHDFSELEALIRAQLVPLV
ncbi:Fic/DOC family protein [Hymenobacter jeollabukensis]|uniref:Fic/DOC family protein n=1 Tax=Hymenobacter jeollabukensis TaxID=2025313 RepID=UPI00148544FE|nr:Fic family protein [Hymenobacter jeollabukensis]